MGGQPKCFLCHKLGHKSFDCPDKKGKVSEPSKGAGVKPGQPSAKKANWARAGQAVALLQGAVNGTPCNIVPDTGADATIVPGNLMFASQLLDEFELVRGVAGSPVKVQCAKVPIQFEGKEYMQRVAVANKELVNECVLFHARASVGCC